MKKKVLTLTVSKKWFNMIVAGEKTEEYREIKMYWLKRLFYQAKDHPYKKPYKYTKITSNTVFFLFEESVAQLLTRFINNKWLKAIPFTHVLFINGYRKDSPRIEKKIESITIGKPKKGLCPDNWLDTEFFVIKFN